MLRKEDPRFIRGKGTYVDDVQLPGMLHLAILRSPYAHARIVSIDTTAAQAHPKVKAVVTGADLAEKGLAWMPTLSNDVQAVLATDKVRFQGQEVAFVVAEDRYAARDALELIDVEYDPLDPVIDARKALDPDAPVIRTDLDGKTDNHCFDWETGDAAATEAVFAKADVVVKQEIVYPAGASRADGDLRSGRRSRPGERQADAVVDQRRRRMHIARCMRWSPACPSTRSGSSRLTSAVGSVTRCRSTRATCARSSDRCCWASR